MPIAEVTMTESSPIHLLEREDTLTARVLSQLETLILSGHFALGDRLPAERELAQRFGVSRTVVREAVAGLSAKGFVQVAPGSGAHVRTPDADTVARSLTLLLQGGATRIPYDQVHEVRTVLEVEIAGLAAAHRTPDDLIGLEALLVEMEAIAAPTERYARADLAFHRALADATGNTLFGILLDALAQILWEVRCSSFQVPEAIVRGMTSHRAIFARVEAGDSEGARVTMRADLELARELQERYNAVTVGKKESSLAPCT